MEPAQSRSSSAVAFDPARKLLYVLDCWNHRIKLFTGEGKYVRQWGREGSGAGEFRLPQSQALDEDGRVYAGDSDSGRVQVFDEHGTFIRQLVSFPSTSPGQGFNALAVAPRHKGGGVCFADTAKCRVVVLTEDGSVVPINDGSFQQPTRVAFDADGLLYVADKHGLQVFVY